MGRHSGYLLWAIVLSSAVTVGQQRPRPPAGPAPIPRITRAQAPIPAPYAGTVEGFVYWDANAIAHKPASDCGGLAVTVSVGTATGPFESYKPLGTLSNNFRYVGPVRGVVNGQVVTYDACIYAYDHVPVGPDLQVQLTVTQPSAFSPVVTPQFGTLGPVKVVNGQCNMLPKVVPSSISDLTAHWGSCQNRVYYVNFALLHPQMLHTLSAGSGSGGMLSGSGIASARTLSQGQTTSAHSNPARRALLVPPPGTTGGASRSAASLSNMAQPRSAALTSAYIAKACLQDPTSRILGVSPQGVAFTEGRQYTIWGCSFGHPPSPKIPIRANDHSIQPIPSQSAQQPESLNHPFSVYIQGTGGGGWNSLILKSFTVESWANNSIVVTLPPVPFVQRNKASAMILNVVGGSGTPVSGGGFQYSPAPAFIPPADPRCAHDPSFRILSIAPSSTLNGMLAVSSHVEYTISGCSFGPSSGSLSISGAEVVEGNLLSFTSHFNVEFWNNNFIVGQFFSDIPIGSGWDLLLSRSTGKTIHLTVAGN